MTNLSVARLIEHPALRRAISEWEHLPDHERNAWTGDSAAPAIREAILPPLARDGVVRVRLLERPDHSSPELLAVLLAALSCRIGFLVPQTHRNNIVAFIRDEGRDYRAPSTRGHQTNAELAFHSDRCDVNALLYVRPAASGGHLSVVSYKNAAEALARTHPDAVRVLFDGLPFDLRDERIFEDPRWHVRPVLWDVGAGLRGHYIRRFINDSQRHPDCPRLSAAQIAALDAWDQALAQLREEGTFAPEPGELLLLDNYRVMHARTEFHDNPADSDHGRLALRAWIAPFQSETLPESLLPLCGATAGGRFRGGVGKGDQYLRCLGTQTPWTPKDSA